jgi:O-methyltransferase
MTSTVEACLQSRELYLDILKKCLTRTLFPESLIPPSHSTLLRTSGPARILSALANPLLSRLGIQLTGQYRPADRAKGLDWPVHAETMIGSARLNHLQSCVATAIEETVPGDLVETGVWRGGACILMRAVLKAYGDDSRKVWAVDSFEGLPKPDGRYAQDEGDRHWQFSDVLAVSLDEVKAAFARYGMLDDQVVFLKGWFKDTLPTAPIGPIAVLRLDGDMYSSTMDVLNILYPRVSPAGFLIIDDYHAVANCRRAVDDYRARHHIQTPILDIDGSGVFWRKT